jgi:phthalate 4,5-dioxygenase
MLSKEENELLTRTGPGTPMGDLFRRFWIPACLSEEVSAPNCPPLRVKLLGEKLIAFRDSKGRVGLVNRYCAHRGADLFYGRNEEEGIRCVYHGWKFNVDGECVEIPNAVVGPEFKASCKLRSYPTLERAGMIWTYMGPTHLKPELPHYEFLFASPEKYYVSKFLADGNYLQSIEGECDSGHVGFLHRFINSDIVSAGSTGGQNYVSRIPHITWRIDETDYGLMMAAERDLGDGRVNLRANLFMMPHTVPIATVRGVTMTSHIRVPIDDESTWLYRPRWNPSRALTDDEVRSFKTAGEDYPELIPGTFIPKENKDNDYLLDRGAQRTYSYTGIKSLAAQDMAVQYDQCGVIADRTKENLVSADRAIVLMRKRLLKAARDLQDGKEPAEASNPKAFNARAVDIVVKKESSWKDEMRSAMDLDRPWTKEFT